jgi:hypothetical protein
MHSSPTRTPWTWSGWGRLTSACAEESPRGGERAAEQGEPAVRVVGESGCSVMELLEEREDEVQPTQEVGALHALRPAELGEGAWPCNSSRLRGPTEELGLAASAEGAAPRRSSASRPWAVACTESGPLSHPPSPMAPVRCCPDPFPPPPYAIAPTWREEEHDLARGRGAGGIHPGRSADFARGESTPKVASRQAQMASRIAKMDFDEAVGRASWCFFLSFREGK